jgi:hypothetical protein
MLPESPLSRPRTVQRAVLYLAASAIWATVMLGALWVRLIPPPPGSSNVVNVISVLVLALATWKIASGRGWARWLFIVMYVLGSLGGALTSLLRPELFRVLPSMMIASAVIQLVLQTIAVALLFMRGSREWFRRDRSESSSQGAV